MKAVLIILDGAPDRPSEALGGLTPLEAARTPSLDRLAERGVNGLMDVLAPGVALSTELAHLLLFGYSVEDYPGRGMIEALGDGLALSEEDVLFSTSFATVAEEGEGFAIAERHHVMTEDEWRELALSLKPFETEGIRIEFLYSGQGYGRLKLSGGASEQVTDADPIYPGLPVTEVRPREGFEGYAPALATCAALNAYLRWAHQELAASALNDRRRRSGLEPVDFLLVKWAGRPRPLVPFEERWGMRGVSIGSSPVLRGTALAAGLDFEHFPSAGDPEEDLRERLRLASGLLPEYDFVHIHTKEADDAAHAGSPGEKVRVVEALDRALDGLEAEGFERHDFLLVVTSDHATPSEGPMVHSGDPVPVTFVGRRVVPDAVSAYSERSVSAGGLGRILGRDLMPLVLNYTDRANLYPWRPTPRQSLAIPQRVIPLKRR